MADRQPGEGTVDQRLYALADDELTKRLLAAHPTFFSGTHVQYLERSRTTDHVPPERLEQSSDEPAFLAMMMILFIIWITIITASIYGLELRQLEHPRAAAVVSLETF
jgi:hypothetical protein